VESGDADALVTILELNKSEQILCLDA